MIEEHATPRSRAGVRADGGGPDNATMVPSYLTYYHFFTTQRVGYAAAIAVVQMILTVGLAVIFLRFQARQQATE